VTDILRANATAARNGADELHAAPLGAVAAAHEQGFIDAEDFSVSDLILIRLRSSPFAECRRHDIPRSSPEVFLTCRQPMSERPPTQPVGQLGRQN